MGLGKVDFGICWQCLTLVYEFYEVGYQLSQTGHVGVGEWRGNFRRVAGRDRGEGAARCAEYRVWCLVNATQGVAVN